MVVGVGGGSAISYLIEYLGEKQHNIQIVAPSYQTALLCIEHHLNIIPIWAVDHIDIAFDSCDEVD